MDIFPTSPDIHASQTLHADFYRDPAWFEASRDKIFARSWLFPNTMLTFYPWGLSANVVVPLAPDRTRVSYQTWVWDRSRLNSGAGAGLDRVEREDEAIVEEVQKGIRSRLYQRGRYSPRWETGVHQFHTLLQEALR
jgi:choline monooxygenase